jgi:O-antigen/teichoic acid export membrane protein
MMIPLLLLGYKSIAIVVVQTILNLMAGAINIWYVLFVLRVRVKLFYFDLKFFKEFSRYTVFIFLIAIVNQIYWNTDQIILGMVANSATVAVYAIATQMSGFFMALSSSISTVFLPKATQMVVKEADNTQLTDILIRIGRLQLVVLGLFLLGFSIFGKEFISLWAGQEYIDAWLIAVILMTPNTIPLIQQFAVSILQAKNSLCIVSHNCDCQCVGKYSACR